MRLTDLIQIFKYLILDGFIFCGSLDNKIDGRHIFDVYAGSDPLQNRIHLIIGHDASHQILFYAGKTFFNKFGFDVVHDDFKAAHGRYLSNTVSHLACTNNTECFDIHVFLLILCMYSWGGLPRVTIRLEWLRYFNDLAVGETAAPACF